MEHEHDDQHQHEEEPDMAVLDNDDEEEEAVATEPATKKRKKDGKAPKKPAVKYEGPYRCETIVSALGSDVCDLASGTMTEADFWCKAAHVFIESFHYRVEMAKTPARVKMDVLMGAVRGLDKKMRKSQDTKKYVDALREQFGAPMHKATLQELIEFGSADE